MKTFDKVLTKQLLVVESDKVEFLSERSLISEEAVVLAFLELKQASYPNQFIVTEDAIKLYSEALEGLLNRALMSLNDMGN